MKVNASTINQLSYCPRAVYLRDVLGVEAPPTPEQQTGLVGHAIRKELSLRQNKILKKAGDEKEVPGLLKTELEKIIADAPHIYKEKLTGVDYQKFVAELRPQLESEVTQLAEKISEMVDELGLKEAVKITTLWKVEYTIKSEELKLSGRVDKVMFDGFHIPVEIKTGEYADGVWEGDRQQVCAYSLLLEDKFGEKVPYGFVEYSKAYEQRPVINTEQLRRRTLDSRDKIIEILEGFVPEICPHRSGKKCDKCALKEECYMI